MSNVNLPTEWGIVDLRQPVVGDSFSWAGVEPTAAKKSFVIHATASDAPNEDGFIIADYHVNNNGWGGVGVHFVCTKDSYPGKYGFTSPGSQIQYVGDLGTWRAGCLDQNPGRVHIEISGNFVNGHPSENQLRNVRRLIDNLLAPNNILPSFNYYSQVTYHNAVPGQNTQCPGWQSPSFNEWFGYLQGGAEPSWFSTQQAPAPIPQPTPVVVNPAPVITATPDYSAQFAWRPEAEKERTVTNPTGADVLDLTDGKVLTHLAVGAVVQNIAGTMTVNGTEWVRTQWSVDNNKWNGIKKSDLSSPTVEVPVTQKDLSGIFEDITPEKLEDSMADLSDTVKSTVDSNWGSLWTHIRAILAILLSPILKALGKKG